MNIAICGLDCSVCPAYVVHQTGDAALREKTAEEWKKQYGAEITPEMVDCAGCTVLEGPHIGYCFECEIRKCGLEKLREAGVEPYPRRAYRTHTTQAALEACVAAEASNDTPPTVTVSGRIISIRESTSI